MSATLYLDLISPYAYFYWHQRRRLAPQIAPKPVLVLFGGILKAWAHKGPAELSTKRLHTYAHCVWVAHQQGIPFTMPPRHPFNPLKALRLMVGSHQLERDLDLAFDWIWGQGNDPELNFAGFAAHLGITDPESVINDANIKTRLIEQTQNAIDRGVWGVPTLDFSHELFWGYDTIEWANAVAQNPLLPQSPPYLQAASCLPGVQRTTTLLGS
jgi:2-hydroxychromene-2-carboxylate isomerase